MAAVMEQDSKEALEKFAVVVRDYPEDPNIHFRYGAYLMQQDPDARDPRDSGRRLNCSRIIFRRW